MDEFINILASKVAEAMNSKSAPAEPTTPRYYTVDELCAMLHISKATYYRHKDLGLITPTAYVGRKPLFDQQAIDEYLKQFVV